MVSSFTSPLCRKLVVFIIFCSIFTQSSCTGTFLSQTFETCGIFLQDFQSNTTKQGDVLREIIEHLQLKQKWPRSLIIKNERSSREIHPDIFRSMKYDCLINVHINFGNDLFSTIPPLQNQLHSSLYKKATFLILVRSCPYQMMTNESRISHFDRQYKIFVVRMELTLRHDQSLAKQLTFNEGRFFCSFCLNPLVRLNLSITKF